MWNDQVKTKYLLPLSFFTTFIIMIMAKTLYNSEKYSNQIYHTELFILVILWILSGLLCFILTKKFIESFAIYFKLTDSLIIYYVAMTFWISAIISFITGESNVLVAGATIILVIVTGYNVSQTREFAIKSNEAQEDGIKAQKKALAFQTKPIINAYIKENSSDLTYLDLIIENVGQGLAHDLKFSFDRPEFRTLSGDEISKLFLFQNGIQNLSPNQKIKITIAHFPTIIENIRKKYNYNDAEHPKELREALKNELHFKMTVKFYDNDHNYDERDFIIDPCLFWGLRYIGRSYTKTEVFDDSHNLINSFYNKKN